MWGEMSPRSRAYYGLAAVANKTAIRKGQPVADINSIAESIQGEIDKQVDIRVRSILESGDKNDWIAYMQAEVEHWKQRCHELEIELLLLENSYDINPDELTIQPKNRGIF